MAAIFMGRIRPSAVSTVSGCFPCPPCFRWLKRSRCNKEAHKKGQCVSGLENYQRVRAGRILKGMAVYGGVGIFLSRLKTDKNVN